MTEYIATVTEYGRGQRQVTLTDEEIVRCRDCAYKTHFFHHDDERWQCANPYQDGDDVEPNAYCWRGEREECGDD